MSIKGYGKIFKGGYTEAEIIADLLRSHDIEVFIENEILGTVMPWVLSPGGSAPVTVYVSDEHLAYAKKILKDFESTAENAE